MLPLNGVDAAKLGNEGNAGLWFNRFFNAYPDKIIEASSGERLTISEICRNKWLSDLVTATNLNPKKNEAVKILVDKRNKVLEKKALRQIDLIKSLQGRVQVYKTEWHFVTGMGLPHPVENGFLWHPTLGVPYLSGSAVKGIVRSWLEVWSDEDENLKEQLLELFGSDDKDPEKQIAASQTGGLIFFDALPVSNVQLGIDIMTPHMSDWYAQGNQIENIQDETEKIPADWHDPVPIKYLVVKEAQFLFSIAPRKKEYVEKAQKMMDLFDSALAWVGAGAKTAVGYGCFYKNQEKLDELNSPPEERIKIKIIQEIEALRTEQISQMLGNNWKKTKKNWGGNKGIYLECIKEKYGDFIKKWETSNDQKERNTFRIIFHEHDQ